MAATPPFTEWVLEKALGALTFVPKRLWRYLFKRHYAAKTTRKRRAAPDVALSRDDLWQAVDHSKPDIDLVETAASQQSVIVGLLSAYLRTAGMPLPNNDFRVLRFAEATASANFAVIANSIEAPTKYLVRVHKRLSTVDRLSLVLKIQQTIYEKRLFGDYSEYIRPSVTSSPSHFLEWYPQEADRQFLKDQLDTEQLKRFLVTVHPLASEVVEGSVTHFFPKNHVDSLRHIGRQFGALQKAVRAEPKWHDKEFSELIAARSSVKYRTYSAKEVRKEIEKLTERCRLRYRQSHQVGELARFWLKNDKLIHQTWRVLEPLHNTRAGTSKALFKWVRNNIVRYKPTYQDFHPHNCFCNNRGDCLLIYDYEGIGFGWTHAASVAFAVHRFTREYLRGVRPCNEADELRQAVNQFLKGYEERGPRLPWRFRRYLWWEIKSVNFLKLLSVVDKVVGAHESSVVDSKQRAEGSLVIEAQKFMAFVEEADAYAVCDH